MLKVIGAGFGRTGTNSLKAALEQLGFGPCHHMDEVIAHPAQIPLWLAVAERDARNWDTVLHGYNSACDFPSQHWYRELMVWSPDAKVVLTVRDPDAWYESALHTIYAIGESIPTRWVGRHLPVTGGVFRLTNHTIWRGLFGGRFLDKAHAIAIYERHIAEVKAHVPPARLLVFDVKQGWEPLCRFLEVPVPEGPFPRRNDTAEFRKRVIALQVVSTGLLLAPVLVAAGIWAAVR